MRKIFATCLVVFALYFAFENFSAELVSANYGYKSKALPKLLKTPTPNATPVRKENDADRKTPTPPPTKENNSINRNRSNSNSANPGQIGGNAEPNQAKIRVDKQIKNRKRMM